MEFCVGTIPPLLLIALKDNDKDSISSNNDNSSVFWCCFEEISLN